MTGNFRGVLWALGSVIFMTCMGLVIKHLGALGVPLAMIVFFRQALVLLISLPWFVRMGPGPFRTRRPGTHLLRALFSVIAFCGLAFALDRLILADAIALSSSTPLWSIVGSVFLLGETVRVRRWTATVIGFIGVLCIVRPEGHFEWAMLAAISSAFFGSLSKITLKKLTETDSVGQIIVHFSLIGTILTVGPCLYFWRTPDLVQAAWMGAMGGFAFIGQFCISKAFSHGDVTVVGPMDFLRMPLAALLGMVLFAEVPDVWTVAGMAIIAISSAYIARREAQAGVIAISSERL
ncbi:MAG: DMT family transporter [Rhodospirillales bacterium]|jgi:drug/metabolite transporter (DMT)-like permease|nr:DMT family transporter [Rhodospirillales bacterium]